MKENELLEVTKEFVIQGLNTLEGIVPFVGNFVTTIRLNRFNKRIKKNEEKILEIFKYLSENDAEFFAEKVGVPVFEKIMQDQEDDKAEFLLLGFENCVKNNVKDEDIIVYYFDLLSEMRVMELKRFVSLSRRTNEAPIIPIVGSDQEMLISSADNKLKRAGLICAKTSWSTENGETINPSTITISQNGDKFLDFLGF